MESKDYVHDTDARGEIGQAPWLSISSAEYIRGSWGSLIWRVNTEVI
jgi:hypothetical protein